MERELFSKYLKLMEDKEESLQSLATEKMSNYIIDVEHCQDFVVNVSSMDLIKKYENFFCDGKYGSTAAYWAIYVYFINRVNWQLQRAVHTNDVDGYSYSRPFKHYRNIFCFEPSQPCKMGLSFSPQTTADESQSS